MFLSKLFAFVEAKAFKGYMFIEEQGIDDGEDPRERLGGGAGGGNLKCHPISLHLLVNLHDGGHLGGLAVEHLPLAQGVILGSWGRVSHQAPHREPASPSAWVSASLSASLMNK